MSNIDLSNITGLEGFDKPFTDCVEWAQYILSPDNDGEAFGIIRSEIRVGAVLRDGNKLLSAFQRLPEFWKTAEALKRRGADLGVFILCVMGAARNILEPSDWMIEEQREPIGGDWRFICFTGQDRAMNIAYALMANMASSEIEDGEDETIFVPVANGVDLHDLMGNPIARWRWRLRP